MWVILLVFALLLMVFGGGCTLIMGGLLLTEPSSALGDIMSVLSIWVPFGLVPLVGGYFLFKLALRLKRKRGADTLPSQGSAKD